MKKRIICFAHKIFREDIKRLSFYYQVNSNFFGKEYTFRDLMKNKFIGVYSTMPTSSLPFWYFPFNEFITNKITTLTFAPMPGYNGQDNFVLEEIKEKFNLSELYLTKKILKYIEDYNSELFNKIYK